VLLFGSPLVVLGAAAPALAQDDAAEEIVVWGDLFARWDNTRWLIETEVGVPWKVTLYKDENKAFDTQEFQLRTILACDKDWKLGNHKYEIDCVIEDLALVASIAEPNISDKDVLRAQEVLDEVDAKLTSAHVQLQVADDGRVTNLQLEGVSNENRRQSVMQETLRQVLSRVVVGFNLKMQKFNQLHEGKWQEFNSTVLTMPLPQGVPGAIGSNLLVHYLNRFQGHVIVQSIGRGSTNVGETMYTLNFTGVSVFDPNEGFMTDRVWALEGEPTASALFMAQAHYFHAGKIRLLGSEDHPDLGASQPVNGRRQESLLMPAWTPIERP
jgi:hypothetical protein